MKIAIGTVQFGMHYGVANQSERMVPIAEVEQILLEANQRGVDTLDTAMSYGESQQALGTVGVGCWRVVGKLQAVPDGVGDISGWARDQTKSSMAKLKITQLHGLLLHRPAQLHGWRGNELYDALQGLKEEGLVRKVGISIYDPTELDQVLDKYKFDLVQAPLNILDRRMLDSGWLARLHAAGVEVHARSIFLQGLLLMARASRPHKFDRWRDIWDEWERWLEAVGLTPLEACLRYALSEQMLDRLVIGVDSFQQFKEIVAVAGESLNSLPNFPSSVDPILINPSMWNTI
jgi:aryl-alcohol dehydrogenase-like predicted oxidoreductase